MTMRIAFVGLGQMGVPMVQRLLQAGLTVQGVDLNPKAHAAFEGQANYQAHTHVADAVAQADGVILMLPDSRVVDAVLWSGPSPLSPHLRAGQWLIDMGSSLPQASQTNAHRLQALGVEFLDAPVSGGVKRAVNGSLSIMVGGSASGFERVQGVLAHLGTTLTHVGEVGSGHAAKALNNYVSAAGLLAVCEALNAAQRFGMDPQVLNQVFNVSTGKNNTTEVKVEAFMLSGRFDSGFAMALMEKDLRTALGFMQDVGQPTPQASHCLATWQAALAELPPGADHTALFRYLSPQPE
jgi:3-hydroxyisobutyrate dehydrogenase